MMLNVHKPEDGTDAPTLVDVANDPLWVERKSKAIVRKIFLFRQSKHKRKIRDKNKKYCTKKAFVRYGGWVPRKMRNWNC